MKPSYILGIDQSTQGTKAILFDGNGKPVLRKDKTHEQIVSKEGWVSHDPQEIYENLIATTRELIRESGIDHDDIAAVGISNQRETTVMWDGQGQPVADAVVWQCARAADIVKRFEDKADDIYQLTGLPLSPYFPAAKMTWLSENTDWKDREGVRFGTIDSWLIYKLTGGKSFYTDYSNASRTQLFNLHTLKWDDALCALFGIDMAMLPRVLDSNSCFGYTDLEGFLQKPVPIHAVLGDSHAALFGQGCHEEGMVKATYGTGSSIMMHVGGKYRGSRSGLASSLAWGVNGKVDYVLEGNINYTGAVISWLVDNVHLLQSPSEAELYARKANPDDRTILIPAFTGLSAPYWRQDARAGIVGMSRTTGQAELVKAALDSIAYQITDVLKAMETDSGILINELRVDGGPTRNHYLMQFQSDILGKNVLVAATEELSALGAAYMAGIASGVYDRDKLFDGSKYDTYITNMESDVRAESYQRWKKAVEMILPDESSDSSSIDRA